MKFKTTVLLSIGLVLSAASAFANEAPKTTQSPGGGLSVQFMAIKASSDGVRIQASPGIDCANFSDDNGQTKLLQFLNPATFKDPTNGQVYTGTSFDHPGDSVTVLVKPSAKPSKAGISGQIVVSPSSIQENEPASGQPIIGVALDFWMNSETHNIHADKAFLITSRDKDMNCHGYAVNLNPKHSALPSEITHATQGAKHEDSVAIVDDQPAAVAKVVEIKTAPRASVVGEEKSLGNLVK